MVEVVQWVLYGTACLGIVVIVVAWAMTIDASIGGPQDLPK